MCSPWVGTRHYLWGRGDYFDQGTFQAHLKSYQEDKIFHSSLLSTTVNLVLVKQGGCQGSCLIL